MNKPALVPRHNDVFCYDVLVTSELNVERIRDRVRFLPPNRPPREGFQGRTICWLLVIGLLPTGKPALRNRE